MLHKLVSSVTVMKITLIFFALLSLVAASAASEPQPKPQIIEKLHEYGIKNVTDFTDFLTRVKRAVKGGKVGDFFRAFTVAYEEVYGRPRQTASLGTIEDMPTEILQGAKSYRPDVGNPLLKDQGRAGRARHRLMGRSKFAVQYKRRVQMSVRGVKYKEGLRKDDVPGCGPPICTIIDMRIKTFKSICHFVEYMNEKGLYRQVFEIQKGSCETASKNLMVIDRELVLLSLKFIFEI